MVPPRSPAPSTNASCSAMVAMTGAVAWGSNSEELAPSMSATDRANSMTMHCRPRQSPSTGILRVRAYGERADLALDAADAEPARHAHPVDVAEVLGGTRLGRALVGRDPPQMDLGVVGEPARADRLGHREVGVGQVDVLADQGDGDLVGRIVHASQQLVPLRPVDVAEREVEPPHDVRVEALAVQHPRDVVDGGRVAGGDDRLLLDVAHERDLALDVRRDRPVGTAHDGVGLDTDGAQRGDGVLGGLGLELAGRPDVRHQRDVQEEDVVAADLVPHLAGRLQERLALDVADRAADLVDDDVDLGAAHGEHAVLDLVRDVRDDLHGVAEVVAAALAGDDVGVDLSGGDVGATDEVLVEEPLVVADVEVGLGAVVGDEHLTVLERVHRAGVDVEVRVELLHGDPEAAGLEQSSEAGGGEALAERGRDPAGDEDVLGNRVSCQGDSRGKLWSGSTKRRADELFDAPRDSSLSTGDRLGRVDTRG